MAYFAHDLGSYKSRQHGACSGRTPLGTSQYDIQHHNECTTHKREGSHGTTGSQRDWRRASLACRYRTNSSSGNNQCPGKITLISSEGDTCNIQTIFRPHFLKVPWSLVRLCIWCIYVFVGGVCTCSMYVCMHVEARDQCWVSSLIPLHLIFLIYCLCMWCSYTYVFMYMWTYEHLQVHMHVCTCV